jgi:hypothetical protein
MVFLIGRPRRCAEGKQRLRNGGQILDGPGLEVGLVQQLAAWMGRVRVAVGGQELPDPVGAQLEDA